MAPYRLLLRLLAPTRRPAQDQIGWCSRDCLGHWNRIQIDLTHEIATSVQLRPLNVPVDIALRLFDGLALGMVLDGVVFLVERLANLKSIAVSDGDVLEYFCQN